MKSNAFSRVLGLTLLVSLIFGKSASSSDLLVGSFNTNEVLRYDGGTGAFLGAFVTAGSGGLSGPGWLVFGPDGNLYVVGSSPGQVLRYDGHTGAFLGVFVAAGSGGLSNPLGTVFGPDRNFYVSSSGTKEVLRYDGGMGAFLGPFVPAGSGGLVFPHGLVFGPDGNLYVSDFNAHRVLRYDGRTGAFLGVFASGDVTFRPSGLVFGPDGNLYVASLFSGQVLRYDGGTGALLGVFAAFNDPGVGLAFGPDGNFYVGNVTHDQVLRFNGATGAFIDVFASAGGLSGPTVLVFDAHPLTALSPAKAWIGLKNSDDAGLRVDLLAEALYRIGGTETKIGQGELDNVPTGSSGFNNALLDSIPLALTSGPVDVPAGASLEMRLSVRRTCSGGGHLSGTVRLWYDGHPVDSGAGRDAGSRFDATIDGSNDDYYLRSGFALSKTAGSSRVSNDVTVNSLAPCPARPFSSFGTWSIALP